MVERRRSARFALALPIDARLSVVHDVQIEHSGTNEIAVLSAAPGVRGEELIIRFGASDTVQRTLLGRTIGSEPRMVQGRVMHRISLAMSPISASRHDTVSTDLRQSGERTTAVFVRQHATRITNLSRGGCQLELSIGLAVGTVATLHSGDGVPSSDPIRVGFAQDRRGTRLYVAGAEFLSLAAPASHSLRSVARRIEAEHAESVNTVVD